MDKRKKAVKLFNDIEKFIFENNLSANPHAFLLNRFYLTLNSKRASNSSLTGIDRASFSSINKKFEDRLKRDFILSFSISFILSLPSPKVFEIENIKTIPRSSFLFLTDSVVIPYEVEKKNQLHFAYLGNSDMETPFSNIENYPVSRNKPFSISLQSTLFDILQNDHNTLKPFSFDIIFDDSLSYGFASVSFIENISKLLRTNGELYLIAKKNFLSSPLTKQNKKALYDHFSTSEINRYKKHLFLKLNKKNEAIYLKNDTFVIKDHIEDTTIKVNKKNLKFNNLLTFDETIRQDQISILKKIEERADSRSGECFKFFIGMFKNGGATPQIETLRKSKRFKPFLRSKEIVPYTSTPIKNWIVPDKDVFFQIPSAENFEREKLLLRYHSVKPVVSFDNSGLYFLNDVASISPRTDDIDLFFAEGYFNSKVIEYYYRIKFPHHNKFLKKNFSIIPFYVCARNIQKIISESVREIRELNSQLSIKDKAEEKINEFIQTKMNQLDKFFFQLFKLTPEEIKIIRTTLEN